MSDELDQLRKQYREAYADNKVLTKANIDLERDKHELELEVAVLKERLLRFSSYHDHEKKKPVTYVIDIFKFPTIAAGITAAIAATEKLLEHFKG